MNKLIISLIFIFSIIVAENNLQFTPKLLIETEFSQELTEDIKAGSSVLAKMEAGFELSFKEKLTAVTNLEADAETENVNVQLNEAFLNYAPKDIIGFTFGQFVNAFGTLKGNALSDPLIYDDVETKVPGFQLDIGTDKIFGALSIYQGLMSANFKACVSAFGINLDDKFTAKVSARIEDASELQADLSFGFGIVPVDIFAFHAELYTELVEKTTEYGTFKKMGYYADAGVFPTEKLSIAFQLNQLFQNVSEDGSEGDLLLLDLSVGYTFFDPFSMTIAFTAEGENISDNYEWTPALTLNAAVEF